MTDEKTAKLNLGEIDYEMKAIVGTEDEVGLDVRKLRANTGLITYDPGYGNTGSCVSDPNASNCRLHRLASDLEVRE